MNDPVSLLRALPPTTLYDVFAEAATQLRAAYFSKLRAATSPDEKERSWAQIHAIRDLRYTVTPEEVDRQIELILAWQHERTVLTAGEE